MVFNKKSRPDDSDRLFLARLKGLEPLTYWFVASHSIQLSYRRITLFSPINIAKFERKVKAFFLVL